MEKKTRLVSPDGDKIGLYESEYNRWLNVLQNFHVNRFDINYRQYTAYTDTRGTTTKISDPVAPELVERVIQKMFERPPKFYVLARGKDLPKEITSVIQGAVDYAWSDPELVQETGTMREKLKVLGREFLVTGNCAVETFYNGESETPDIRVIPIEDVIFDPAASLKRSKVYYIRQYVNLDYLLDNAEITKEGKVVGGLFKNMDQVKASYSEEETTTKQDPSSNVITRGGQQVEERPVDQILLISRWEGKHCTRIVDWTTVIQEYDNDILDDDPLDFAMDIEVPKQPYAFSLLDFINGLTHAKDLILNQVVDFGSKALNPPLFVDPNLSPASRQSLRNAYKIGGIVYATAQQAQHQPMSPLPPIGFDLLTYIQQRSEGVSGIGAYLSGVPNQANDKTKGTKGGVQSLIAQAVSPVRDRQINIEESIVEPVTKKFLKYIAALMGKNELKYAMVSGQAAKWVTITKNLMNGDIMLQDLVTAGLVGTDPDPQTGITPVQELAQMMVQQGQDPSKQVLFDVDWIVRVETGSMAEQDSEKDILNMQEWVNFRLQFRIPTDLQKVSEEMGLRMGIKDPAQYDMETSGPPGQPPPRNASTLPFIFPKETINFGDMPPAGKEQMAQNAGINLSPQDVAPAIISPMPGQYPQRGTSMDYASSQPQQQPQGQPGQQPAGANYGQPPAEAMMGMNGPMAGGGQPGQVPQTPQGMPGAMPPNGGQPIPGMPAMAGASPNMPQGLPQMPGQHGGTPGGLPPIALPQQAPFMKSLTKKKKKRGF